VPGFKPVQTHVLNPKCISLGELYGAYNPTTNEWSDGLASNIIRTAVADDEQKWHWVVFDGPVDALWIESMNTGRCKFITKLFRAPHVLVVAFHRRFACTLMSAWSCAVLYTD
jgi:hypothetical protein